MNKLLRYSVGIDMSKDKFSACISAIDAGQNVTIKASRTFRNVPNGFSDFYKWVSRHLSSDIPVCYIMEATGVYYERLGIFLYQFDNTDFGNCS